MDIHPTTPTSTSAPVPHIGKQLGDAAASVDNALRAFGLMHGEKLEHCVGIAFFTFDRRKIEQLTDLMEWAHTFAAHAHDASGIRREIIDDALYVIAAAAPVYAVYDVECSMYTAPNDDDITMPHDAASTQHIFGVMASMYPRLRDIATKYADVHAIYAAMKNG